MCTVIIFSDKEKTIITMNRDERLEREAEKPPTQWETPKIIAPIDPKSAGTWIGLAENGNWACLLNGYLEIESTLENPKSRGVIIPQILDNPQPDELLENMDLSNLYSFRLILGQDSHITEYFWNGSFLEKNILSNQTWQIFTSSSLKQNEVTAYRKQAFVKWLQEGAELSKENIPKISLFCEEDKKDYGVMMQRSYSETKSISQIVIEQEKPTYMTYWAASELR